MTALLPDAPLPPDAAFYARGVCDVAVDLLGRTLAYKGRVGVIVETEAYHASEPACHAYVGNTPRTATLFQAPGRAYVYRSYGIHALVNAVCEREGVGAAVLIRALEPTEGIANMRERRGLDRATDLCSGPGKLSQALGIGLDLNGTDLSSGPLRIGPLEWPDIAHVAGRRIGITKAVELPWRYCAVGAPSVSRPWPPGLRDANRRLAEQGLRQTER